MGDKQLNLLGEVLSDCVFCNIVAGKEDAYHVFEDDRILVFLDTRPLFHGHCLLVPREHHETLPNLPSGQVNHLFQRVRQLAEAVEVAMEAEGTFVAINNTVSQSVPHLHVHVAPRVEDDGLRGFFWPRTEYESSEQANRIAKSIEEEMVRLTANESPEA